MMLTQTVLAVVLLGHAVAAWAVPIVALCVSRSESVALGDHVGS
ncbi:hypothetical protein [Bradyrhizobium liaoningense]|nr:hypothetical protein [Bradyrhizobium liaoningense]